MRAGGQRGFTLIELAIVLAIVAILAIIAVPNLNAMMPRFRLNRTVKEFTDQVQLARLLSISHNREYRICLDSSAVDTDPTSPNTLTNMGKYTVEAGDKSAGSTEWDILPLASGSDDSDDEGTFVLTYSSSNRGYTGISLTGWTSLTGAGSGNADCIVFSPRGWVSNPSGDFATGYIEVYFRNKAANPTNDSRTVLISRGGLGRIRTGDGT